MFLPDRHDFAGAARAALGLAALVLAAPAHASTAQSVLADAQAMAVETAAQTGSFIQRVLDGDMLAIKAASFGFSGFIALIGLWLLLRVPRERALALPDLRGDASGGDAGAGEGEEVAPPAIRLLEAVAAAKAQMSISKAEQKRRK